MSMTGTPERDRSAETARFTRRVVFLEEPEVAEWLEHHAESWGHSLAAEIRCAIRYWRAANDSVQPE
jgi:hypothetical protein